MRQCRLVNGLKTTTAWIDVRGAKQGAKVQLLPSKEVWTVQEAYGNQLPDNLVKLIQQLHRNSLPSVEGIGHGVT